MIEKKTMGYVDFNYPDYEAKAVTVVIDNETGKVEIYRYDEDGNEWYTPNDNDHFYPTVDEAASALDKYRHELIAKMEEVRGYIETMNNWSSGAKEGEPFYFTERDYLPYQNTIKARDETYYRNRAERLEEENGILVGIFRKGFLNIKGDSFRLDDVQQLKWGKKHVEIVLTNGKTVQTASEAEFNVIRYLFGNNISRYAYTHLDESEDSE